MSKWVGPAPKEYPYRLIQDNVVIDEDGVAQKKTNLEHNVEKNVNEYLSWLLKSV